jgi:hypothetical protein
VSASGPSLDLLRRLAERHARSELATHGGLTPSAQIFYGNAVDIVYPNQDEAWSHFVQHMLSERTLYNAHAVVFFRQRVEGGDVSVIIMPSDGVPIELRIAAEGA